MEQRTGALEGEDMRITEEVIDIDYKETRRFFERRADKFSDDNPYSVTMYQDRHTELVRERNRKETEKLIPMLNLNADSRVLDVACGIGRWADAMPDCIKEYCGLDFSRELVEIARKRNKKDNFSFWEGAANEVEQIVQKTGGGYTIEFSWWEYLCISTTGIWQLPWSRLRKLVRNILLFV